MPSRSEHAPEHAPDAGSEALLRRQVALFEQALQTGPGAGDSTDQQLNRAYSRISGLYGVMPGLLLVVDARGLIRHANEQAGLMLGIQCRALPGRALSELLPDSPRLLATLQNGDGSLRCETEFRQYDGESLPVLLSAGREDGGDGSAQYVLVGLDLREQRQRELALRQAQKLEAMGSLAAGIAHEINTPLQYIGDNLGFIDDSVRALLDLMQACAQLPETPDAEALLTLRERLRATDPAFTAAQLPQALERSREGIRRVSRIVDSLRGFTHRSTAAAPVRLDELVGDALEICRHEYKYVADIVLALPPLPPVPGRHDHLLQVLINLLTNAAHAIRERFGDDARGRIGITGSLCADGRVRLDISDNGCGIPADIAHRIFDPFFTTKAMGQGTGQGLAISRAIIVEQHQGSLDWTPGDDGGACFSITLPCESDPP